MGSTSKKVIFVMGIPCSGKSSYIQNNFPDVATIDLYDYQANIQTIEDVWKSYESVKDEIIKRLGNEDVVICEHTLLKAERREYYIHALKEAYPKINCEIILCRPDIDAYKRNYMARHGEPVTDDFIKNRYDGFLEVLEEPTEAEGFSKVSIYKS